MASSDPYKNYRFRVEIDGIQQAGFQEASIADSSQEPIKYRVGTDPIYSTKLPGQIEYGNVTLKWGITDSTELYDWRLQVEEGKVDEARKNISIILQDDLGNDKTRWNLGRAWPSKYTAPELNATASEVAIESLEIVCETVKRVQ